MSLGTRTSKRGRKPLVKEEKDLDLSLTDFSCPICLEVLIEPVKMPCSHELCLPCFKSMLDLTNFSCPMCRMRISSWSRYASNSNSLVNQERWEFIQKAFPIEIKNRIEGKTAQILTESIERQKKGIPEPEIKHDSKHCCKPGEIKKEYQEYLRREQERIKVEKENEEKQSLDFIQKLIQEEENLSLNDYMNILNTNNTQRSAQQSSDTLRLSSSSRERVFKNINNHLNEIIQLSQQQTSSSGPCSSSSLQERPCTSKPSSRHLTPVVSINKTGPSTSTYSLRARPSIKRNRDLKPGETPTQSVDVDDEDQDLKTTEKRKTSRAARNGKTSGIGNSMVNSSTSSNDSSVNQSVDSVSLLSNEDQEESGLIIKRSLRPRAAKQAKH